MSLVTLITDFGTADGYVGEMKGVMLERSPGATLVDVTHEIPPGDVRAGGWALWRIWSRFPAGTVHLAVIDPGVGGERDAVAARVAGRWFVGPDNGLLTRVLADGGAGTAADERGERAPGSVRGVGPSPGVEALRGLSPERIGLAPLSDTFHGRDLFAPAAAHLADGRDPAGLGPALDAAGLTRLGTGLPDRPEGPEGPIRGRIVHVDRFGNLVTDVPSGWLPERPRVEVGGRVVEGLWGSFADVASREPLLTRGSVGTLEISVRDGSASERLGVGRGDEVVVRPSG